MSFYCTAPSGSPCGLKISHGLPTSSNLSWTPVSKDKQNGIIHGYIVQVIGADSTLREIDGAESDATSAEVSNLKPFMKYTFSVSAKTKAGSGPAATVSLKTPEAGETWYSIIITPCACARGKAIGFVCHLSVCCQH